MASFISRSWYWASLAWLGACASTPPQVVSVARADLGCERLDIAEVSRGHFAAAGCGRGAIYTRSCRAGSGCSWVRLRGAHESAGADWNAAAAGEIAGGRGESKAPPREVIAAPPPAPREVIAAPPANSGTQTPAPAPNAPSAPAPGFAPQQTPLSQGELSAPYETEVPATPVAQRVEYAPPPPFMETRPSPPVTTYVWVDGWWWWGSSRWVWVPGYWSPPRSGYAYVSGNWYYGNGYWWYGPGGWARPNSTLVVHQFYPRPRTVQTVRAFTPYRMSPAEPMHPYHAGAPSPRSFGPQASPLNHYPSSLSSPSHHPHVSPSSGMMHGGAPGVAYDRSVQPSTAPSAVYPSGAPSGPSYAPSPGVRGPQLSPAPHYHSAPLHSAPSSAPSSAPRGTMGTRGGSLAPRH